jgi:DNA-binding NarL/FixJ family response regulator
VGITPLLQWKGKLKRVLVVQGDHLLSDGIANLLTQESDLDVIDVINTPFINGSSLIDQIDKIQPSVLIVEENNGFGDLSPLIRLLKNTHEFRVIIIDSWKNLIHIYEKQEIPIAKSADLITAIRRKQKQPEY